MPEDLGRLGALIESDPKAALKLLEGIEGRVVVPHEGQQQVLSNEARFRVLNCGRRWGKTIIGAKEAIREAKTISDTRRRDGGKKTVWWVAPTYKVVKRGYREVLRQLPPDALTHEPPPYTHFDAGRSVVLRFKNGSVMEFYSAERPGGMLGEGVDFVVLDEAATMPGTIWEQIIRPTLADHQGRAMLISTPRGRNWFYDRWRAGQDPAVGNWASWTFPSNSNPHLPASEFEDMRADMTRLTFEQEVLAKFLAAGSSVFLMEDTAVHGNVILDDFFVEGAPPKGHVVLGIDLAKSNDYTVIYGARARDRRNCYYERFNDISWKEQRRRIRRAVRRLEAKGASGVTLVMDSTGVGDPIVEKMEEDGYDVVGINFTSTKNNMVKLLANDLETGRAFVLREAQFEEFENYGMKITAGGRITYGAPEGDSNHDDAVSAKMLQHWGLVNEGVPEGMILSGASAEEPQGPDDADGEAAVDFDDDEGYSDLIDEDEFDDEPVDTGVAEVTQTARLPSQSELLKRGWF